MNPSINRQVTPIAKVCCRLWRKGARGRGSADRSSKPMTSTGLTPNLHPRISSQSPLQPRSFLISRSERKSHRFANLSSFNSSDVFPALGGRFLLPASESRMIAPFTVQCASNSSSASSAEGAKLVESPTVAQLEALIERPPSSPSAYDAEQIQVLEGLDPVRKRPGMYIGSTGPRGLHHLVYEVVDNAIDEAQAGHATLVEVELRADGAVSVRDNGRGIPVDVHSVTGKSALETVLTVLHAGGKFGGSDSGYKVSGGLHGVGVSVVNALSEELEATVWRHGRKYWQKYERGKALGDVGALSLEEGEGVGSGTQIVFRPDPTIFTSGIAFDYGTIVTRLRELAFLNPRVTIHISDEVYVREDEFHFGGGLTEYVHFLTAGKEVLHDPISFLVEGEEGSVDCSLQWCSDAYSDSVLGYANSIRTSDGGAHVDGLKAAVTRTLNRVGRKSKMLKEKDENLSGEHAREGLTAVVAVRVSNPEFEGQTKTRLGNPGIRKLVEAAVGEALGEYLDLHPAVADSILSKALQAFKAAEAAKKARELVRRKSVLKSSTLPGKLSDCSCQDPALAEIFIVEGDSAGGSAKQGRDRKFQAVLPLRGKILNIERKDESVMYKNTEIQNLILGLGLGLKGDEFDVRQLRYHKIIILTDADVDGAHIRTLLLTFLFRYQKALFEKGHVYVGVPPLYKVDRGRSSKYIYSEEELQAYLKALPANSAHSMQRFKGLGEMMPVQLWETTLDPTTRRLRRLTLDDVGAASSMLQQLMGDKVRTAQLMGDGGGRGSWGQRLSGGRVGGGVQVGPRKELIRSAGARLNAAMLDI